AAREISVCRIIHRHSDGPPQRASKKCRNPFRRVRPPEQRPVALADSTRLQLACKLKGRIRSLLIRPSRKPIPHALRVSALRPSGQKIFKKADDRTLLHQLQPRFLSERWSIRIVGALSHSCDWLRFLACLR